MCDVGYDLDDCGGESCVPSGLAPAEGMSGVDNALAGFAPIVADVGGNLGPLNKALSDKLCGLTEGRTCEGGDDGGERCTRDEDCRAPMLAASPETVAPRSRRPRFVS